MLYVWRKPTLLCSHSLQPARYTQSLPVGDHDFMFQFIAFEKHGGTGMGEYLLGLITLENLQLPSIGYGPVLVQIGNQGEFSIAVIPELIQVAFVKTVIVINGVMKFAGIDTGITALVQTGDKFISQLQELLFK